MLNDWIMHGDWYKMYWFLNLEIDQVSFLKRSPIVDEIAVVYVAYMVRCLL